MSLLQAAVLGLVQGLSEFLPISSSAHLALLPWLLQWPDQGLSYDVALHWGTLLALLVHFRADFLGLARAGLSREDSPERRLLLGIVLATIPGVLAGLLLDDHAERLFRAPERIALCLMGFGVLLWAADRFGKKEKGLEALDWRACLLIGAAQAVAIVPGVSRSGVTLTAALWLGLRRGDAARFSFLLSAPIVLGAAVLKLKDIAPGELGPAFFTGIAVSALSGLAAIRLFLSWLKTRDLAVFAIYRVALGLLVILLGCATPPHRHARELGFDLPRRPAPETLTPRARRIREHVVELAEKIGQRNPMHPASLEAARDYVAGSLRGFGYEPAILPYHARFLGGIPDGTTFYNVSVRAGPEPGPEAGLWVLGAHYDSAWETPGADDNASGTAVLLELARDLRDNPPPVPVELVAFSTEEPPAFGTDNMGSRHHARALKAAGTPVAGMISLEMLGYFDSRKGSQIYPPYTRWFVPDTGDFIALAGNFSSRRFLARVRRGWPKGTNPPLLAKWLPEFQTLRLSDNASYWDEGFSALMLTDTASYRNPRYHEGDDTPETLDYEKTAVIAESLLAVLRRRD